MYERQKSTDQVMIAETAVVVGDVVLAKNCGIWYGAVLRGDEGHIEVGEDTNIQDNAVVHENVTLGKGCTVGHGAIVHGCTVGDNTLIGMGATILNGARIGREDVYKRQLPGSLDDPVHVLFLLCGELCQLLGNLFLHRNSHCAADLAVYERYDPGDGGRIQWNADFPACGPPFGGIGISR